MEIVKFKLPTRNYSKFGGFEIKMPRDNVIYPQVHKKGMWAKMEMKSLEKFLDTTKSYDLIDVGANVGLITLYLNSKKNLIEQSYCVEPDDINFDCLQFNTKHLQNCNLFQFGLDKESGIKHFYKDVRNHGNNSLFKNQELEDAGFEISSIKLSSVKEFFNQINISRPIIYKSDTQGNDITIINNIPHEAWNKIEYAVIEVWNMNDENLDIFLDRLSKFSRFIQGKTEITYDQVCENIKNLKQRQINLICGL